MKTINWGITAAMMVAMGVALNSVALGAAAGLALGLTMTEQTDNPEEEITDE